MIFMISGHDLGDTIRTKLYFVIFFLFASFLAITIYNAFWDDITSNVADAGNRAGVFKPHIGKELLNDTSSSAE